MKLHIKAIILVFLSLLFTDQSYGQQIDKNNTYFHFGINGPRENGIHILEIIPGSNNMYTHHMVISSEKFRVCQLGVGNKDTGDSFYLHNPGVTGIYEFNEFTDDMYSLTVHVNDLTFHDHSVSVHIKEVVKHPYNPMQYYLIKGQFQGVVKHFYTEHDEYYNSEERTDYYTIFGTFQYIHPDYQKKIKQKAKKKKS